MSHESRSKSHAGASSYSHSTVFRSKQARGGWFRGYITPTGYGAPPGGLMFVEVLDWLSGI